MTSICYPGRIAVQPHNAGTAHGYFWRIDDAGGIGGNWNGPHPTPDDANAAAIRWLISRAQHAPQLEHNAAISPFPTSIGD